MTVDVVLGISTVILGVLVIALIVTVVLLGNRLDRLEQKLRISP